MATLEEVAALAARLPPDDRRRLAETILQDLDVPDGQRPWTWADIRGIAPNLLGGEDAQAWVSRSRREDDEHRERVLRRET